MWRISQRNCYYVGCCSKAIMERVLFCFNTEIMSEAPPNSAVHSEDFGIPDELPITVEQFATLVESGTFAKSSGQIELIRGKIIKMNPQGPEHCDPVDFLVEWSHESTNKKFTIRDEKPIVVPNLDSTPEPDVCWVKRARYGKRHPNPEEIFLLMEVSFSSSKFDREVKRLLYADAEILEYWRFDIRSRTLEIYREPQSGDFQSVEVHDQSKVVTPMCCPGAKLKIADVFAGQ